MILLIGSVGAGKTSLKQRLMNEELVYRKTQALDFGKVFLDCPGEYLEMPQYYHVLIDEGNRASEIWAIQDASKPTTSYPPEFARVFLKPVIGIVTKADHPNADVQRAIDILNRSGIKENIYITSAMTGQGYDTLRQRLEKLYGKDDQTAL